MITARFWIGRRVGVIAFFSDFLVVIWLLLAVLRFLNLLHEVVIFHLLRIITFSNRIRFRLLLILWNFFLFSLWRFLIFLKVFSVWNFLLYIFKPFICNGFRFILLPFIILSFYSPLKSRFLTLFLLWLSQLNVFLSSLLIFTLLLSCLAARLLLSTFKHPRFLEHLCASSTLKATFFFFKGRNI